MADDGISPYNTIQFYDHLVADLGPHRVDEFLKFYTIPGFSHGFGPFVPAFDSFPALQAWVEDGIEPGTLVATDTNSDTAGRTRPICEYPSWPQYTGGDENAATSFTCVTITDEGPSLRITAEPAAPDGDNDWYRTPVTLTATAAPGAQEPPAALAAAVAADDGAIQIDYHFGDRAWQNYDDPITLSADGSHTVIFRATDAQGRTPPVEVWEGRIDGTAPEVKAYADHDAGTIVLEASDEVSGLARMEYATADDDDEWRIYDAPIAVTADLTGITYRAIDRAGNTSEASHLAYAAGFDPAMQASPGTVRPEETVTVTGEQIPPGYYDLVLRSSPVVVGAVVVDASGEFTTTFVVPPDTTAGAHVVELVTADEEVIATAPLRVITESELPATGVENDPKALALLGALSALMGLGLVTLRHRATAR